MRSLNIFGLCDQDTLWENLLSRTLGTITADTGGECDQREYVNLRPPSLLPFSI